MRDYVNDLGEPKYEARKFRLPLERERRHSLLNHYTATLVHISAETLTNTWRHLSGSDRNAVSRVGIGVHHWRNRYTTYCTAGAR